MSDDLAPLSPDQLAAFYGRLADAVDNNKGSLSVSLAALLLRHWLENRDAKSVFTFKAPKHLKHHVKVAEVLAYHRGVFLTEEQARTSTGKRWAGVIPRLQSQPPSWDGVQPLSMTYQSLVDIPLRYQMTGNDADKDLLYAFHGFQLKSSVTVTGDKGNGGGSIQVDFLTWKAEVEDIYHWDYTKHFTVPNPDYDSTESDAVNPQSKTIVVYHSNAKRLEDAGLAAPYKAKSKRWHVKDSELTKAADVDPSRKL